MTISYSCGQIELVMDRERAKSIAEGELRRLESDAGIALALNEAKALQQRCGWLFPYNSREFLETGNNSARLAGNGPIYVRHDGAVFFLASGAPLDEQILALEATFGEREIGS